MIKQEETKTRRIRQRKEDEKNKKTGYHNNDDMVCCSQFEGMQKAELYTKNEIKCSLVLGQWFHFCC